MIRALPRHLQNGVARLVWWDYFADRGCTQRWKQLDWALNTHDEPEIEEWQQALIGLGYPEAAAVRRVNRYQKFFGYTDDARRKRVLLANTRYGPMEFLRGRRSMPQHDRQTARHLAIRIVVQPRLRTVQSITGENERQVETASRAQRQRSELDKRFQSPWRGIRSLQGKPVAIADTDSLRRAEYLKRSVAKPRRRQSGCAELIGDVIRRPLQSLGERPAPAKFIGRQIAKVRGQP